MIVIGCHKVVYYQYTEFISKNNQHRFKDAKVKSIEVRMYSRHGTERCLVKLLDVYLSKLPHDSLHLYMHLLREIPSDCTKPHYTQHRVGVNALKAVLPNLSGELGCVGRYTNHCLRATAMSRMFNVCVPKKIIADKSEHCSTEALRSYERISVELQRRASDAIAGESRQACEDLKPIAPKIDLPFFSQSMVNCMINLSLNYDSH